MASKKKGRVEEQEKTTGASYIINFYNEVALLTHNYAEYLNLIEEIEYKYKDIAKISENERSLLQTAVKSLKYYINKTFVMYKCIIETSKQTEDKKVNALRNKIKENFIIERVVLEEYVILLNTLLIQKVMKNLLETSQEIVESIYTE